MRITDTTHEVLHAILKEREHQFNKFGHDNILGSGTDSISLACLGEEYGEAAHEVCEFQLDELEIPEYHQKLYNELLQVAAVACAFAEKVKIRSEAMGSTVFHDR